MRIAMLPLMALTCVACVGAPDTDTPPGELTATRGTVYGASTGEGALSSVFDVDVDLEGRVYLSEPEFGRVVVFERDGTFGGPIGGQGEGPGEFTFPGNLGWLGDTLTVLEFQRGIHLFERDGTFVGLISFTIVGDSRTWVLSPMAALSDGTVGSFIPTMAADVLERGVEHEPWMKMSRTGGLLDTLVARRVGEFFTYHREGRPRNAAHPLRSGEALAIPPDGSHLVLATTDPIESAEAASYTLHRLDLHGDTVHSATIPFTPREITAADRVAVVHAMTSLEEDDGRFAARVRALDEGIDWPAHFPAFATVLVGADESVWVERYIARDGATRWDVLDADFRRSGVVFLPSDLEVKLVSRDAVYGVELDGFDVPWVVRFDISR